MRWAAAYTPVPQVLDEGSDETGRWFVTAALPGANAVTDRWKAEPRTAVTAIGEGLAALHDALPVDRCPFDWTAAARVVDIERRAAAGAIDPAVWHDEHRTLTLAEAIAILRDVPPPDRTVVCHGDACAPNTLLTDDGRWSGHVDLGALGVGDRWADLAIATWSCDWNYGPSWQGRLLDAYGTAQDADRTRYYRLLWDLGP
jgi:kanamycin kinase